MAIEDTKPTPTPSAETLKNPFKTLSLHDWVYIPHILSRKERAMLVFFTALALITGVGGVTVGFYRITHDSPKLGGTYREGVIKAPERVNPLFLSNNDTDRDVVSLVFSNLLYYDSEGNLKPDLAENYSISPDGKSYTVNIKNNAIWHDGVPLTADDVIFTVKAIQDPSYKSSLRPNWQGVTIERLGDYEVRFVLKQPYSPFLQNLVLPIIPRHIWERVPPEGASLSEINLKPIGTGPYRFKELERNSKEEMTKYILEANTNYYREGPYLENIEFTFYESEEELLQAFRGGLIDGISIVSPKNVEVLKGLGASVSTIRMPRVFAIFINEANPILKDKQIRTALALAIPKEELITKVLGGGAIPVDSPIPPGTFGHDPEIPRTGFEPERAKSILDKAGWKEIGANGIRQKKAAKKGASPVPLKIILTTSDWKDLSKSAEVIRDYWKAVGIDTEIKIMPISELETDVIRPRKYDALLFGEILGRDPDPFAFWHSSQLKDPGLNIALYHSPKVDALLEQARKSTDRNDIEAKYREFQRIVVADSPTIFLYSPTYFYAHRSNVKNVEVKAVVLPSERFSAANTWYIKTKRSF
ncbi:MAG: peptide ABC transporter substrate-binding protein [Candidatus Sungbacteria bacterium]|nr:peptide ABC transporter substrate-binding protein [Candidatus Sungbacteria bacterium]